MTQPDEQSIADVRRRYSAYVAGQNRGGFLRQYAIELVLLGVGMSLFAGGILFLLLGIVGIFGIVIGLGIIVIALFSLFYRRKWAVGQANLMRTGVPVSGIVVAFNEQLSAPGSFSMSCVVLISFEPAGNDRGFMSLLALRVSELQGTTQTDKDLRYISGLVAEVYKEKYCRRKLPASLTWGPTVHCAHLRVVRACLPEGYLTGNLLPCIGIPGDKGPLELLPWQIAAGQDMSNSDSK